MSKRRKVLRDLQECEGNSSEKAFGQYNLNGTIMSKRRKFSGMCRNMHVEEAQVLRDFLECEGRRDEQFRVESVWAQHTLKGDKHVEEAQKSQECAGTCVSKRRKVLVKSR